MARSTIEKQLAAVPLFTGFTSKHLAELSRLSTTIDLAAGRELIKEGNTGREFFVVLAGEAEVSRDGEVIATRGSDSFFGETALLLDRPRNATVVAATDMTVAVIERRDFKQLLEGHPDLYPLLVTAMAKRLDEDQHND